MRRGVLCYCGMRTHQRGPRASCPGRFFPCTIADAEMATDSVLGAAQRQGLGRDPLGPIKGIRPSFPRWRESRPRPEELDSRLRGKDDRNAREGRSKRAGVTIHAAMTVRMRVPPTAPAHRRSPGCRGRRLSRSRGIACTARRLCPFGLSVRTPGRANSGSAR